MIASNRRVLALTRRGDMIIRKYVSFLITLWRPKYYYITKQIPKDIIQLYMMLICASIPVFFDIPFLHQQIKSNKLRIMFSYEGTEWACRHCGKEFFKKRYLDEYKRAVHEGIKRKSGWTPKGNTYNILAGNVVNNFLGGDIWLDTKGQYM